MVSSRRRSVGRHNGVCVGSTLEVFTKGGSWAKAQVKEWRPGSHAEFVENRGDFRKLGSSRRRSRANEEVAGSGSSAGDGTAVQEEVIPVDSWLFVHYVGTSSLGDEWVLYDKKGPVCTQDLLGQGQCVCSAHISEYEGGDAEQSNVNGAGEGGDKSGADTGDGAAVDGSTPGASGSTAKRGRGRPRKYPLPDDAASATSSAHTGGAGDTAAPHTTPKKRVRSRVEGQTKAKTTGKGQTRPRRTVAEEETDQPEELLETPTKRGRGRPKGSTKAKTIAMLAASVEPPLSSRRARRSAQHRIEDDENAGAEEDAQQEQEEEQLDEELLSAKKPPSRASKQKKRPSKAPKTNNKRAKLSHDDDSNDDEVKSIEMDEDEEYDEEEDGDEDDEEEDDEDEDDDDDDDDASDESTDVEAVTRRSKRPRRASTTTESVGNVNLRSGKKAAVTVSGDEDNEEEEEEVEYDEGKQKQEEEEEEEEENMDEDETKKDDVENKDKEAGGENGEDVKSVDPMEKKKQQRKDRYADIFDAIPTEEELEKLRNGRTKATPFRVNGLYARLGISGAEVYRQAGLHGGMVNAAYSWTKGIFSHRSNVIEAGKIVAKWYYENMHRSPPPPEEDAEEQRLIEAEERAKLAKLEAERLAKIKASLPKPPGSNHKNRSGPRSTPDAPLGFRLKPSSDTWEAYVDLSADVEPVVLGQYNLSDDASAVHTKAQAAVNDQVKKLQNEKTAAADKKLSDCCFYCSKRDDRAIHQCDLCIRQFHFDCVKHGQQEAGFTRVKAKRTYTCSKCLKVLHGVAKNVAKTMDAAKPASTRRPVRRRASDEEGATSLEAIGNGDILPAPESAFGFPVSVSFIRPPNTTRPRLKPRRKDHIDYASKTQWIGEGFVDGIWRSRSKMYFTKFRYIDEPDTIFHLLDHVLLFRVTPDGEEEEFDEEEETHGPHGNSPPHGPHRGTVSTSIQSSSSSTAAPTDAGTTVKEEERGDQDGDGKTKKTHGHPEFYIGQIEAMWEEPDGERKARIAWFFWPEEAQLDQGQVVLQDEVFSSNEVDVVDLSVIAKKIEILPYKEFMERKNNNNDNHKVSTSTGENQPMEIDGDDKDEGADQAMEPTTPTGSDVKAAMATRHSEQRVEKKEANMDVLKLDIGAELRIKHREKLAATPSVLFARRHYHYRGSMMMGKDHSAPKEGNGLDPWLHSFILAKPDQPDSESLLTEEDRATRICQYTQGVADGENDPSIEETRDIKDLDAAMKMGPKCSYCFEDLSFQGYFKCAVCSNVHLCFDCFSIGRQGLVQFNGGGSNTDEPQQRHDVKVLHRSNHPYNVAPPALDYANPQLAQKVLEVLCHKYGLEKPTFRLCGIVRGPLPSTETKGASSRYRYGAVLLNSEDRVKNKPQRTGVVARVIGSKYGRTVEEAIGICAIDTLASVFGITNKLNVPVLSSTWKAREALRLIDAMSIHGLSWGPAADVVGSKNSSACAEFFACYLHPAWAAETEWGQKLLEANADLDREPYVNNIPPPSQQALERAVADAIEWGVAVHEMTARRSKLARRNKRGIAFAVVDGNTVFAKRPDGFGTRVTKETDEILKMNMDLSNSEMDANLIREQHLSAPKSKAPDSGLSDSSCLICGSSENVEKMLLCDGCDGEFHLYCLDPPLHAVPNTDWFCQDCMQDREYLYDHCSYGSAGETLVKLIGKMGMCDKKDKEVEIRAKEWKDNEKVINNATKKAIDMGFKFGAATPKARTKKAKAAEAKAAGNDASSSSSSKANNRKGKAESSSSGQTKVLNPREKVLAQIAWAGRHFAVQTVSTLEAANRGLAEALAHVVAQRDALLSLLKKQQSSDSCLEDDTKKNDAMEIDATVVSSSSSSSSSSSEQKQPPESSTEV